MSPLMRSVAEAGRRGIDGKVRPWTIAARDFFAESEAARALFAELVGTRADDVAIVPAVSYAMAIAAANIRVRRGQTIVVLPDQFPSNVYPWRELARENGAEIVTAREPGNGDMTDSVLAAIDRRTAIAALPHCRWTDGALVDLAAVGRRAREVGAALVVDATQSLGALPLDVAEVQPDLLVSAGYKWLMGPYSLGFAYIAPRHHGWRPLEHGWIARARSDDFARLVDYRDEFQPGARRFDVGERSNFILVPMMRAALAQVRAWGPANVQVTLAAMTEAIAGRAAALGLSAPPVGRRAGHYLGLGFAGGVPEGLPARLAAEKVYVSVRGSSMRITPHLYNDDEDVERLFRALTAAL
ncbi:MAG: aminotransferase class V-fold PLP-dependent enzyme [Proteobacteria bacterium]|nr:aminotransferase class V-fold PLP-dependent enzyme [Pseudomonadota bacterium]